MPVSPLVSIIIPTYNRADLIGETLRSVQAQTYENWECIIVDDFSTDHTEKVVFEFCENDKRFFYLKNTRKKGAPSARNIGVEYSKGAYLIFLDSDDLLSKSCIKERVARFQTNPESDFLVFSTLEFKNDITNTGVLINVPKVEDPIMRFLNLDVPWLSTGPIWKREQFLKLGGWNEELLSWQDWELHLRALLRGYKYIYFSIVDNYWRNDEEKNAIGKASTSIKHLQSHFNVIKSIKENLIDKPVYLARLNSLFYWIGERALEQNNIQLALDVIDAADYNISPLTKFTNKIWVKMFKKYKVVLQPQPGFGTRLKVKYKID